MPERIDQARLDEIRRRHGLVETIAAGDVALKRRGAEHVGLCPFHQEKTGSFTVNEAKGFYHCFGCGAHGDVIGFVMHDRGLDFPAAIDWLEDTAPVKPRVRHATPAARQLDAPERTALARRIWQDGRPAAGGPVERYLQGRRIAVAPPGTLRFHPQLRNPYSRRWHPTMLAAVQRERNSLVAVHLTALAIAPDGEVSKAPIECPKIVNGPKRGGSVRLALAAPTLCICEGIETGFSIMQRSGLAVWAALDCGNLPAIVIPGFVTELLICCDHDHEKPVKTRRGDELRAAGEYFGRRARESHAVPGRKIRLYRPEEFGDYNDGEAS